MNAVDRAKALSEEFPGPVTLTRDDEKMMMIFRRGSLQKYQLETR